MLDINPNANIAIVAHADMDGLFSAMLVKRKYPNARVFQTNYGKELNLSDQFDTVFVVDFSFDNLNTLIELEKRFQLIWIDHHSIVRESESRGFNPPGLRRTDVSAAMLVWEYLYPGEDVPVAVRYVSDYDTWKWTEGNIKALYFHYGIGTYDLRPGDKKTDKIFEQILTNNDLVDRICVVGKRLDDYTKLHNKIVTDDGFFETEIDGIKAIACNIKNTNSLLFDSVEEKYKDFPIRILFSYFANIGKYRVSLFSKDLSICPVNGLASKYGGGGHPGAAGFTCNELPFKLPSPKDIPSYENIFRPLQEAVIEDPILRRYSDSGNIPLVWSHQYSQAFGPFSTVFVNHPSVSISALYQTGLSNLYSIGMFYSLTNTGWYRCRIYVLDPRKDIKDVCEELNKTLPKEDRSEFKIVGNAIWGYMKSVPTPFTVSQGKDFSL